MSPGYSARLAHQTNKFTALDDLIRLHINPVQVTIHRDQALTVI
jgi:hypothetical protein